jgi:carbamoyl-phosphate synthase large subunit
MPKNTDIKSILVIGSGPIVIGQAAEFDYAGTQACMALKEEGYKVILVNNNPATIMTDQSIADTVYFEPLTVESLEKVIEKERPDGLLATLGGQTGLNLAFQLSELGILEKYELKVLGSTIESIKKGEDRDAFRTLMNELGEPVPPSEIVHSENEALLFAETIGFPIIVRPAYTLGGTGGGIANSMEELSGLIKGGLQESAINQCLVEKSIAGFKEIEYEVMRDSSNTCIIICNMENIDPVGIHTGDSIVVAPSQTLTDDEYHMLRSSAIKIISALEIIGGCNVQFALDPDSKKYYLIEVNPRVSRSSALASKATGYPIAKIAAKLSVGYQLSELLNPVTEETYASFEPTLDYIVVKFPKWPFDKFPGIERKLGTQMKATGEVMGIDRNFERAILKAVRSLEIEHEDLILPKLTAKSTDELLDVLKAQTDERFFILLELMRRGLGLSTLHELTKIDLFFLHCFARLIKIESRVLELNLDTVSKEEFAFIKEKGFSDCFLASAWKTTEKSIRNVRKEQGIIPAYKMVDTCAAEFAASSNYYYSTYFGETDRVPSENKKVLIIGSGPIRIGQGIEFDYCSVNGVLALKEENIETVMINNNPETVSTDFAITDRLYFEPLKLEDILNVVEAENISEVIVQFGGQTAINLAKDLEEYGITILGTNSELIDIVEDRERFYHLLEHLEIPHVQGAIANNETEIKEATKKIGFPVLVRPSYVIGGQGMKILNNNKEFLSFIENEYIQYPVLIDQYMYAKEAELDLVADGNQIFVPAIMEHIEKTGVHSGDSFSVLPPIDISYDIQQKMVDYAQAIVAHLSYQGLMNIQYIIDGEEVYILEVNPRASRTIPIVSKVTGFPLVHIATKVLLGNQSLSDLIGQSYDAWKKVPYVCVKYPVFSNYALNGLDSKTGPEMKSTGEGISIGENLGIALNKCFHALLKKPTPTKGAILCEKLADISGLSELGQSTGISLIQTNDAENGLQEEGVIAFYSTGMDEKAIAARKKATKHRIITFTEKEALNAFLLAVPASEWGVTSIAEWLKQMKEDVVVR